MPLESCMILLDCSQYMRNGDYVPTRFQAQQDAAHLLIGAKKEDHAESTIGVAAGTELLVSPTDDMAKLLGALHRARLGASSYDLPAAVAVASLALKHRRNKNGAQRIVLFVGTPVTTDVKTLQKAGRQLKKNNVALDVVALGEWEGNETPLQELVDAANGRTEDGAERTCHLVSVPAGVLPSDVLAASPIVAGGGVMAAAGLGGGDFGLVGGIDPNMDPELAMALRVSMEEERARQERLAAAAAPVDTGLSMEEEALLQQALAMSMNEPDGGVDEGDDQKPAADDAMEEDDDEDAAMQMALQMSLGGAGDGAAAFQDPSFVADMLQEMPDAEVEELLKKAEEDPKKDDAP